MFGLTFPWLLAGAAVALPGLFVIYMLRQRSQRTVQVSALFLWSQVRASQSGGNKVQSFRSSVLFWLELVVLCLLLIAAAGPSLSLKKQRGPLMIVLDNSYSMKAGHPSSPMKRAKEAMYRAINAGDYSFVRLIGAGRSPQLWGGLIQSRREADEALRQWKGRAPVAALDKAISLAWQLGGARARVLVLTDHAPTQKELPARLRWEAFGAVTENTAIVHASRVQIDQADWCLLEVAHWGKKPRVVRVLLSTDGGKTHKAIKLSLQPGERRRLRFSMSDPSQVLEARLDKDALPIDDKVTLLPKLRRPVRVQLALKEPALRRLVTKALVATKRATLTNQQPEWILTERRRLVALPPSAWSLHLLQETGEAAYRGPFVQDRTHPLLQGVALKGVIWGAGKGKGLPGVPLLTVGDIPLISSRERADGGIGVWMRWRPQLSTLTLTSNWPVLVWNLLEWRSRQRAGVREHNIRLGAVTTLVVREGVSEVEVLPPQGRPFTRQVIGRSLRLAGTYPGLYKLKAGTLEHRFAVNVLHAAESDLRKQQSGTWGSWPPGYLRKRASISMAWLLILLALICLSLHLRMIATQEMPS